MYLGSEARYAWQSCWMPDARMYKGMPSIVRVEGAEKVISRRGDSEGSKVSVKRAGESPQQHNIKPIFE